MKSKKGKGAKKKGVYAPSGAANVEFAAAWPGGGAACMIDVAAYHPGGDCYSGNQLY